MLPVFIQFFWFALHPFYVSITSVDYNRDAQRMEISCRIFHDDLEVALKAHGAPEKIDLIRPMDKAETDSLLADYLRGHFSLSVNDKPIALHYVGYEIEDDVAWCYLEAKQADPVQRIAIDNRVLFDQFPKQSNIVHVTAYGKRKSTKLDNPMRRAVFEFAERHSNSSSSKSLSNRLPSMSANSIPPLR